MANLTSHPLISIIILNYNGKELLEECINSVLSNEYENFEVILVDNASTDGSMDLAERKFNHDRRIRFIRIKANLYFTGGMNAGMKKAKGEWLVLLGNDTRLEKDFLTELVNGLQDEKIGAVTPKIFISDDPQKLENTGGLLDIFGYAKMRGRLEEDKHQYDSNSEVFFASGAGPIYRRDVLSEIGFFDTKFMAHSEDVDLSWRIRLKGLKVIFLPKAKMYHKISATISKSTRKSTLLFHIRKNRIAILIKNYNLFNLLRIILIVYLLYFLVFIKESLFDRNLKIAMSSVLAMFWNIKELPYLLKQRRIVQRQIRQVSDREILQFMQRNSILINEYIKPFLKKIFTHYG